MGRGRALGVLAALVVVGVIALVLQLAGGGDDTSGTNPTAGGSTPTAAPKATPSQLPTAVPSAAPKLSTQQRAASKKADEHLRAFVVKSAAALVHNSTGKVDLGSFAAGPALGEIQSLAVQYHHEDMTVRGTPKALTSEVVSANLTGRPPSVTLDNRPVSVHDAKGRNLSRHRSPSELMVLNLYELQQLNGNWVVVNHSIPANSSCKNIPAPS